MRARIELHQHRVGIELSLALAAAAWVLWVLATRPDNLLGIPLDRFAHFPLSVGLGVWLPLLARTRWSTLGDLRPEGGALVIRGGLRARRIPLDHVRGVRVAPGARGASVLVELDGGVLAAALDDIEDARRLADEIRRDAKARDGVAVRSSKLGIVASVLRPTASLFALGYFLHVVPHVIGGGKAFYGLGALLAAGVLLVVHLARLRADMRDPSAGGLTGSRVWDYSRALRAHLALHGRAADAQDPAGAPRPRLAEHGETLGAWLGRLRRELASPEAYRGAGEGRWAKIEHAYRSAEVPLRERALALRILTRGEAGEARRRIAEIEPLAEEEQAWIESVALASDDDQALARVERRPPDFRA